MWGAIVQAILPSLLGPLEAAYKDYINGQISKEQLAASVSKALIGSFAQIDGALQESLAKTYGSFMQAAAQSPVMQRVWAFVCISQLLVLLWHQVGIPALAAFIGSGYRYPSSGATVDWAYALVALCLGAPAISSRIGPAASWAADNLKRLTSK